MSDLSAPEPPISRAAIDRYEEHWRVAHADCAADSSISSLRQARFVLTQHNDCGPRCLQHLTATAYSTGLIEDI
ncbi:hypothetical protein [Nocardia lasii]|uniref:Uncharacterized protein n=1 Tax=Nocardia lasii TaxID=1616107 RepID=A0ABW1JS89_9NOCA